MTPNFKTAELKEALEASLGFEIARLDRLKCVNSLNYRVVRASDGFVFALKCSPPERQDSFTRLVRHLDSLSGSRAATRLFRAECPATFRGYRLLCQTWCEGERLFPDEIPESRFREFLDDYQVFSAALQCCTEVLPPFPIMQWRRACREKCKGVWGRMLRPRIDMFPADAAVWRQDRLRVIHGDLHPGNLLFKDGRVSGFIDLEGLMLGYPAEDVLRYFIFALERLPCLSWRRRAVLLARFAETVRYLGYPRSEWQVSLCECWLGRLWKKLSDGCPGAAVTVKLTVAQKLYAKLWRIVRENTRSDL